MNTRDQITAVLDAAPTLTTGGFMPKNHPDQINRLSDMLTAESVQQFDASVAFINCVGHNRSVAPRSQSSYALKHTAERWAGRYIANGVFIAAAIHMGVPILRCDVSPNAYIALSKRGLKAENGNAKVSHGSGEIVLLRAE